VKTGSIISRRDFIVLSSLSIGALFVPLPGCKNVEESREAGYLSEDEIKILNAVLDVLFPDDGFGPSHRDFNATQYIINVLNDPFYDGEVKVFLIEGINDVNSIAHSMFDQDLPSLPYDQKQRVIKKALEKGGKHEQWLSKITTLVIEALLSDPIYGGNTNEVGWKWVDHFVGIPRPDKETAYQQLYPWKYPTTQSND